MLRGPTERGGTRRRAVSIRFLRSALAHWAGQGFATLDAQGLVTSFNEGAERMTGWTADEVIGGPIDPFYPEEARAAGEPERMLARARESAGIEVEGWWRRKDGSPFWAIVEVAPVSLGRRFAGYAILARDETARRRAERDLELLAEASHALAVSLDVRATLERLAELAVPWLGDWCSVDLLDEDGTWLAARWHRDPDRRAQAEALAARYPPRAAALGTIAAALRRGEVLHARAVRPEELAAAVGSEEAGRALAGLGIRSAVVVPLAARGTTFGALTVASAESQRTLGDPEVHLAQELARRASLAIDNARLHEAAQRAVRVREDVLAVVSHDLKSPLNALRLGVRLQLKRAEDEERSEAERRQLDLLDRAVDRMERLIADLLDMARIRAGRLPLTRRPERVRSLVEDALAEARPAALDRGVGIRLAGEPPDAEVECDRSRILQVLANLLGNAVKFAGQAAEVTLTVEADAERVRFAVRDRGAGIPAEDVPHLFEPYWSAEKGGKLGTGLGLFISRGIVESHGGRVGVETAPGEGSTFWFTLPRAARA